MTATALPSPADMRRIHERTQRDPVWFAENILGVHLYDRQREMLESVRDNPQTSVCGGNGVGKDYCVGAAVIPWWMMAHADSKQCKVVVMGPTHRQVSEIVWRETRAAFNNAKFPLGGRMMPSESKWDINGENYFALGFATDKALNITGFHSPHLLVIVTEAHNFPEDAFVMIKRLQAERLLLSFNSFTQSGEAFESHHSKRHLYNAITITAYDSPNVKAGKLVVPGVVTQEDIDGYAADWGEESPYFRATVNAEFADTEDGLLPLRWLQAAQERPGVDAGGELHVGIDVAGPGEDETTLYIRSGPSIIHEWKSRMPEPRGEVVAELMPYKSRIAIVNVDSAGIGYYFAQHLRDQGYNVREVNVGESAHDPEKFANLKAELYWGLRLRFKDGDVDGLTDEVAMSQLAGIRYGHNSRGQVQIERKEDAKKRGVTSPDRAEGIMLCFAYGDEVGSTAELLEALQQAQEAQQAPATRHEQNARQDRDQASAYDRSF